MDIFDLTIRKLHQGLLDKKYSCRDLVSLSLENIRKYDDKIKAFLTVCDEEALKKADLLDQKIKNNKPVGILAGIPYSAKDVFSTFQVKTTGSSKILENYYPVYNATVINKLNLEDAILIGKTNNDAFGFGSSTENSDFQVTHNPWNLNKVAGGSSGGSAAAVACGMGIFSLAEDTGGSIRQPACFCGISGIKVTYGRVSRYGVLAYGSSLDTIGIMANNVSDISLLLKIIAGKDEFDATTLTDLVPDYELELEKSTKGLTVGIPKEYFSQGMNTDVLESINEAVIKFKELGFKVVDVSLPHTKYAIPAYYLSGISEVSANLSRYDGVRFGYRDQNAKTIEEIYEKSREIGFGPEVKRRIMLGSYALSAGYYDAYYKKAQQIRTLLKNDFEEAFRNVNLLLAPVSPFPAFDIGEKSSDPLQMWLTDVFTVTINPAGVPALSIPCGFSKDNLPIGMQLIGPQLSEGLLFRAAKAYENVTDWNLKKPKL